MHQILGINAPEDLDSSLEDSITVLTVSVAAEN